MGSRTLLLILGLHFTLLGNLEAIGCGQGLISHQNKCIDTDECTDLEHGPPPCGSYSTCYNTQGSFYCQCLPGFISTTTVNFTFSGQCTDLNECLQKQQACGNNTICLNTIGSYNCRCQPGFRSNITNVTRHCADMDECNVTAGICGVGGTCDNLEGSYACLCNPGHSNYGNKKAQCSVLTCDQFKADETPGQTVPGLAGLLSLMRNSCLALSNSGDAVGGRLTGEILLENVYTEMDSFLSQGILSNSREVSGLLGTVEDAMRLIGPQLRDTHTTMETDHTGLHFTLLGNLEAIGCGQGLISHQNKCIDTDECTDLEHGPPPCGSYSTCYNTQGSFYCQCLPGFISTTTVNFTFSGQCTDLNECLEKQQACGNNTICLNTIGSYNCRCQPGFRSNITNVTRHCADMDECNVTAGICGVGGTCDNLEGSYACLCNPGHSNYGNKKAQCSVLTCDQFKADETPGQTVPGLAGLLSLMRNSCLALSNSGDAVGGRLTGEILLENVYTEMDSFLSQGILSNSREVSGLLGTVEDAMRLIGPQLRDTHTTMETDHTATELAVRRGQTPPTGLISLANDNARLDTSWETATGNGTYPGFALAGLVCYKTVERSVNNSFQYLTDTDTDTDTASKPSYQISSKVVTALVSNPATEHLNQPVILTFKHLQVRAESSEIIYTCVFWSEGRVHEEGGAWSRRGCTKVTSNATHTVCSCTHLSSFAVLMALYPVKHTFELSLLTWLGLSVSVVCLLLCILTFWLCRFIQGTRTTIHLHLCVCLFIADLIFLSGISHTQSKGGCRVVAGLLHLFFLGSFSWMLLEGVQLYLMVVLVFNTTIRPLYLYFMNLCDSSSYCKPLYLYFMKLCDSSSYCRRLYLYFMKLCDSSSYCRPLYLYFMNLCDSSSYCRPLYLYFMKLCDSSSYCKPLYLPLYLYAVGYVLPLAIVIISAITYPDGYGTTQHCWLSLERGFIWSFFGPVCTIIILNVFFFIITVWRLAQKFSSLNPDLSNLRKIKVFTVTAVAQLCVLGTMWLFGVFQFQEEGTVVMTYLFTILNSLQGALLFIMHCLLNKTVREEYCKLLSCICTPQKKRYSEVSTTNPSSSQSQGSRSAENTWESQK
ncbi:CD97 antigen [Salmo trutta]|uniref:CD97 antigen n=1 Tax=Salmo trutta TaxID=8032 RepID=UPI00113099AC|nr:CD97 antigen-like [Salmo trutta]